MSNKRLISFWQDSFCVNDIIIADFDANGYQDILFACAIGSSRLFYNYCSSPGNVPHFIDTTELLPDTLRKNLNYSSGVASDFDNDGYQDFITQADGQSRIWWNEYPYGISEEGKKQRISFLVFPNPFYDKFSIKYGIPDKLDVTFKLYDPLGRVIKILHIFPKNSGEYTLQMGKPLKAGVYFLRIKAGKFKATQKLIKVR